MGHHTKATLHLDLPITESMVKKRWKMTKKKKIHSYKMTTREHKMYFFHWWITVKRHRTHSCSTVMYCISTNFFCSAKWAAGGRAVGSGESKVGALPLPPCSAYYTVINVHMSCILHSNSRMFSIFCSNSSMFTHCSAYSTVIQVYSACYSVIQVSSMLCSNSSMSSIFYSNSSMSCILHSNSNSAYYIHLSYVYHIKQ